MSTGRIRAIAGMLAAIFSAKPTEAAKIENHIGMNRTQLMGYKNGLLLNSAGPMPHRLPNQRQRRKLHRQVPQLRK